MATYSWSIPSGNTITGSTIIKDTDNKIQAIMDDLNDFVNSSGSHDNQGLTYDMVDKLTSQVISGVKTFSNGIVSNVTGNIVGNVTGNIVGNVTGDVSGNATTATTSTTATTANSLSGLTSSVAELNYSDGVTSAIQTQMDAKIEVDDYATSTVGGTIKMKLVGNVLYITNNGTNP